MMKTPRPVEDIGIHRVSLLLNGEYIYFAVEQGILIKGFHNRRILKS